MNNDQAYLIVLTSFLRQAETIRRLPRWLFERNLLSKSMADQVTTIASFPAGFATLAGLVYAVVATPQHVWSHTCWSKVRLWKSPRMVHPEYDPEKILDDISATQTPGLERLYYRLGRGVTKTLQRFLKVRRGVEEDENLRERVAALHLLMWHRKFEPLTTDPTQSTVLSPAGPGDIQMDDIRDPHAPSTENRTAIDIVVKVVDHKKRPVTTITEAECTVHLTRAMLRKLLDQAEINDPVKSDVETSFFINDLSKTRLPNEVYAQAAAPWDVFITEVGFKGIESLFAAGIILGSSGGAWLGLTMASIFPQRVAAGLYASSFGQVAAPANIYEPMERYTEHVFIAPGTLWVNEGEEDGYCIRPCLEWRWFDDAVRNTLGYALQYVVMYMLTWYKMQLRTFFFPEGYRKTVDTVRYVVLVLEPVVLLVCFWRLTRQRKSETLRYSLLAIYAVMWAAAIVCMVFGQQNFLRKYLHKEFEEVPRVVELIASAGAVAVMHARGGRDARDVSHGQWGLIWAIGVCTAVW